MAAYGVHFESVIYKGWVIAVRFVVFNSFDLKLFSSAVARMDCIHDIAFSTLTYRYGD